MPAYTWKQEQEEGVEEEERRSKGTQPSSPSSGPYEREGGREGGREGDEKERIMCM